MPTFKLAKDETVLEDDYPIVPRYVYICDKRFTRYEGFVETTVAKWKALNGFTEIRRCDLFDHKDAKLGDAVE